MLQTNKPVLGSDTSRALLIKNEDSYRPENYGDKDLDLHLFITGEIGSPDSVSSRLYDIDHLVDSFIGGNCGILARYGDKVYIKNVFTAEDFDNWKLEETEICMSVDAARRLFIQIERLLVELPERAEIVWHEDGSATIEWQPTSIRQVAVERVKDRYSVIDQGGVQEGDYLLVDFLNSFLDLLCIDDKATIAWLYNPEGKSIAVGSLTILNKIVKWVEGSIVVQNKKMYKSSVAQPYYFFRLLCEHATRISNEKPSKITLKWYKHGAAFEWERDCDVASK